MFMPDDPGVGWTPEESDGKRDWLTIIVGCVGIAFFLFVVAVLLVSSALARGKPCKEGELKHQVMASKLAAQFGEGSWLQAPVGDGTILMDIFVSPRNPSGGNTWTVTVTNEDDCSKVALGGVDLMISSEVPLLGERM